MVLIFIIIIGNIFTIMGCVSVFIKNESAEIIVFKNVFPARAEPVVDRNDTFSKSVYNPLWLQFYFSKYVHRMLMKFHLCLFRVKQSPNSITCLISIMFWSVIQSSFSSGNNLSLLHFFNLIGLLLSLLNFLNISTILFTIEIVWELILIIFTIFGTEVVRN